VPRDTSPALGLRQPTAANGSPVPATPADPLASLVQLLTEVRDLLTRQAGAAAELLRAREAALMCGTSTPTWWRLHSAGLVPAPVRLGGVTAWRTDELRRWVAAGCPDRRAWEAMEAAKR
jgi:predicted DNA-binding transcriptional regulator AlpA